MNNVARKLAGGLLALAITLGIAALSRVPYVPAAAEQAQLRLSWRTRGEQVRECRKLSAEELAKLPVHMRRPEVCEGRVLPRHLRVVLNDRVLLDDTVHAAGARGDRPLYVFHEIPLPPGKHRLQLSFVRAGESQQAGRQAPPARLELATSLELRRGDVALITYDADQRALVARGPGTASPAPPTPSPGSGAEPWK